MRAILQKNIYTHTSIHTYICEASEIKSPIKLYKTKQKFNIMTT